MGSLFRSEKMTLAQLFLQTDAAYSCVRELGELLNPEVNVFQRKFTNEVRRCDEMERKLRYFAKQLDKANIEVRPSMNVEAPEPHEMYDLESTFEVLESEVKQIIKNNGTLKKNLLDLVELRHILQKTQRFIEEADEYSKLGHLTNSSTPPPSGEDKKLMDMEEEEKKNEDDTLSFVAGVISRERMHTFERVMWRAGRGNVFLKQADIEEKLEDPITGVFEKKVVFMLFFQGTQLKTRVKKICEGFRATLYKCPESAGERQKMMVSVEQRIKELSAVLETSENHCAAQLNEIACNLETWQIKVTKIKGIYYTMNMFNLDVTQKCLIAECWCPLEALEQIQGALKLGTKKSGSTVPSILNRVRSDKKPPTYHKVNRFTRGFQAIIDAYGMATYEEVNPAPYTIITFPFLFAVMFGDAGHGTVMALFALSLIIFEKKLANNKVGGEMFMMIFHGRYVVFLMGCFSIYTGLIYNEVFSKSINIFGSSWNASYTSASDYIKTDLIADCCPGRNNCVTMGSGYYGVTVFPREAMYFQQPYPFGLDPIWSVSENKLFFENSYKMKDAVILGIGQMLFGVILNSFNHVHYRKYINVFVEFIPQVFFLICIFCWMNFMIFYKWCNFYVNPNTAPSLLITLINMFLKFGKAPHVNATATSPTLNEYSVFGPSPYDAMIQRYIEMVLVVISVLCIPWMLCIKPFYLCYKDKRTNKNYYSPDVSFASSSESGYSDFEDDIAEQKKELNLEKASAEAGLQKEEKKEFEFSEAFVYQAIHTIEYCLGTISNTASYLRLWALSLAHSELSEVLWKMVLDIAVSQAQTMGPIVGAFLMFACWFFWALLTIGILLIMEGLSAFLHALRLHWVEFQNKFYDGEGYRFRPFFFEAILNGEDED